MICKKCKKEIPENSKFCNLCGAPQQKKKGKYTVRPDGLHEAIRIINGRRVAFRGRTDAEVEKKMLAYREEAQRGREFSVVASEWEAAHFPTLSPNTLKGYRVALHRAIEQFKGRYISTITPPEIKQHLKSLARKCFSQKVINNQRLVYNLIFTYAVDESGDLTSNPCISVKVPKGKEKVPREPASEEDETAIKANVNKWLLPYFIMYTGMRKGEALATRGKNILLNEGEITVTNSVYYESNMPHLKSPKSAAGTRKIPLLDPLRPFLPKLKPNQFLFSSDGGKTPLKKREYDKLWESFKQETGITATAHNIRHSYASMLYECGVSSKDAQVFLGHSTKAMTDDIYTHIRETRKKDVAKQLNSALKLEYTESTQ